VSVMIFMGCGRAEMVFLRERRSREHVSYITSVRAFPSMFELLSIYTCFGTRFSGIQHPTLDLPTDPGDK